MASERIAYFLFFRFLCDKRDLASLSWAEGFVCVGVPSRIKTLSTSPSRYELGLSRKAERTPSLRPWVLTISLRKPIFSISRSTTRDPAMIDWLLSWPIAGFFLRVLVLILRRAKCTDSTAFLFIE